MKPQKICKPSTYFDIVESFTNNETLSNNYMLPPEVSELINDGRLFYCCDDNNCYFLVKKEAGVTRLYYLLNNQSATFNIDIEDALVTEILFRGNASEPTKEITFLENSGFKLNLRRDQFSGTLPTTAPDIEPVFAISEKEAIECISLFNSTFDKYSGDYIPRNYAGSLIKNKALLCVYDGSHNLQGALHTNIIGKNAWVAHLVVDSKYRGIGISCKLMNMFVTNALNLNCKRAMLWVQHNNEPAVSLYHKYGLSYANKSTISLIKK